MPPEEKPTIEQAIDNAIEQATPEPLETTDNAEGGDDDGSSQDPAAQADDAAAAAAAAEAGAGGDADDKPGEGSGDAGAADAGKPGAKDAGGAADGKDGAGKPAGSAAAKKDVPAAEGDAGDAGKKGPKQPDPVNDPIPVELKGKTRERMTSLIDAVKTTSKELEESRSQTDGFLRAIAETGAQPETFARHVEVLRLMNSDDPAEQRAALKALRGAADRLAKDLGETEPGKELEGHQDLVDEVEAGDITKARAVEIATARNAKKAEETRAARVKQETDGQAAEKQAIEAATATLNEWETAQAKVDPLYYRKRAAIENAAKALIPTITPDKWLAAYKRLYASVDATKLPAVTPRVGDGGQRRMPAGTGNRQPMRPRQGAGGGGVREPQSIEEAIEGGIARASR